MPKILQNYTPFQFLIFRVSLSFYLIFLFSVYLPQLFLGDGVSFHFFNFLPKEYVFIFFALVSTALLFGFLQRCLSLLLFLFWILECNPITFRYNPGTFIVAYLLLVLATTPTGNDWGIRKLSYQLSWVLMFVLLFFDLFTSLPNLLDLPAFGIKPQVQFRPPTLWLDFRLLALSTFFLLIPFFRLRFFAWSILLGLNIAWMMRFGIQDASLTVILGLIFLFNGAWLTENSDPKIKPIIFFDGFCILCNRFTKYIYREDFSHHFFYSPIQGKTAKETLPRELITQPNSIIFLKNGKIFDKSEAVFQILSEIGGIWTFFFWTRFLPKFITDRAYDIVASNRYGWFGSLTECQIPQEIDKAFQKP